MSGLSAEEIESREDTSTLVGAASLFVLGFALVFVALGATLSAVGGLIQPQKILLTRASGVFIIVMALVMLGIIRVPVLYRERRFHLGREIGIWSSLPLGMAFAFGWTPCIGPVLTSIFSVALTEGSAQRGALLLFIYALGLGVPFIAAALFTGRVLQSLGWFKRHYLAVNRAGGAVLLVMGVFLLLNRWTQLMAPVMQWYAGLNLQP
jgi:cytochrome c-type biogenesis protein